MGEKKLTKVKRLEYSFIIILTVIVLSLSLSFSMAYFKFNKQFSSSGELPILHIDKIVETNDINYLNDGTIRYNLNDVNFKVSLTTNGNNISGFVRVYVLISWLDGLSNTKRDDSNNLVTICKLNFDETVWEILGDEERGYYYYLKDKNAMEPNKEIILFNSVSFDDTFSTTYSNKLVEITMLAEICQATNKPENW